MDLLGVTAGAQESRFVGGAQQIPIRLAEALGERVMLGVPIWRVAQDATSVRLEGESLTVQADQVIVTIPPALAGRLRYSPQLPGLRDQLTQRMPMGTVIKVHSIYDTPFWREAGLTGQASSDSGAMRITFDNSPEDAQLWRLLGFIEGDEGRYWGQRSLRGAPRGGAGVPGTLLRRGCRAIPTSTSSNHGSRRSIHAAVMLATCLLACGRHTARRCGRRSDACIGPAQRRRRSGTAIWKAHCSRASVRRRRC